MFRLSVGALLPLITEGQVLFSTCTIPRDPPHPIQPRVPPSGGCSAGLRGAAAALLRRGGPRHWGAALGGHGHRPRAGQWEGEGPYELLFHIDVYFFFYIV